MVAANVVRGDAALADWSALSGSRALILDVRDPAELENGRIDDAINIPLGELRERLEELPRDREIWVSCGVGQRAYYACRLLTQRGYKARNLSGGYESYRAWYPMGSRQWEP
jgi:rhodanese-related sulfurtransferase